MAIMVNQVGYEAAAPAKRAVVSDPGGYVLKNTAGEIIWQGQTGAAVWDPLCEENLYSLDFGSVRTGGRYYLENESGERSDTFEIGTDVLAGVHNAMVKALYFQRCGCALEEKYAGPYTHAACHMANSLIYGEEGHSFEARGGWHDAGDYGRYITPGAVTVGHLLYAYKLYPQSFCEPLNIPESGNNVADVLNECRYELEWMLKMQRKDGGVYHKLTAWRHAPFVMPEEDGDDFYAYPVSSLATADFCACMALGTRAYDSVDRIFAWRMEAAAKLSWQWLEKHPEPVLFVNPEGSNTGEYGDSTDTDERLWAAAEMLLLAARRGEERSKYMAALERILSTGLAATDFGWTDVAGFAALAVLTDFRRTAGEKIEEIFRRQVLREADRLADLSTRNVFAIAMEAEDFCWGSNMVVTNRGILLALACEILRAETRDMSGDQAREAAARMARYQEVIQAQADYLLGKNITGYSFVTGYGDHAYRHPHLRTTAADGIEEPMAGWVSGGPNGRPGDELAIREIPAGTPPMKCYLDREECYSLNEMTIYWNSSAVFVTAFLRGRAAAAEAL